MQTPQAQAVVLEMRRLEPPSRSLFSLHAHPHHLTEQGEHVVGQLQSSAETENCFCCNDLLWL